MAADNTGPPKGLTAKQKAFCAEYLIDLNATQAAIRAGYSPRTAASIGQENLTKPEIQQVLAELQNARAERTEITQDWVMTNLVEVVERCMTRAPVMVRQGREMVQKVDADGNHVWEFNSKGALGGLDLIGRHLGMFKVAPEPPKDTGLQALVAYMAERRSQRREEPE